MLWKAWAPPVARLVSIATVVGCSTAVQLTAVLTGRSYCSMEATLLNRQKSEVLTVALSYCTLRSKSYLHAGEVLRARITSAGT